MTNWKREIKNGLPGYTQPDLKADDLALNEIIGLIEKAERPVLYCGGGYRSALTAEVAQRMGYKNILSLSGGYKAMAAAGDMNSAEIGAAQRSVARDDAADRVAIRRQIIASEHREGPVARSSTQA